jgi:hypothetical protein
MCTAALDKSFVAQVCGGIVDQSAAVRQQCCTGAASVMLPGTRQPADVAVELVYIDAALDAASRYLAQHCACVEVELLGGCGLPYQVDRDVSVLEHQCAFKAHNKLLLRTERLGTSI